MMTNASSNRDQNEIVLVARLLLIVLFVTSGWGKINNYTGTAGFMAQSGVPLPTVATAVAILVELFAGAAVAIGLFARPLALVLALFTVATAFLGHAFWSMEGAAAYNAMLHFYKNLAIAGGFLLLYVTGPGRYSVDAAMGRSVSSAVT